MSWVWSAWARLGGMFRKQRLEIDLRDELRQHSELLVEENLRRGMTAEQARRRARLALGNTLAIQENYREQAGVPALETLVQDVRYALRWLRKSPGFTVVAVLTLALGIGANAAVFSAVNSLLLEPLPFAAPRRLVSVWQMYLPAGLYQAHAERTRTMDLAALSNASFNLDAEGEAVRVDGGLVSANLFSVLGVHPTLGRDFRPEENRAGSPGVVMLSYSLWQRQFNADRNVLGRAVSVDGMDRQVVGVMPAGFAYPNRQVEMWMPFDNTRDALWGTVWVNVVGRLRPGVRLEQARAETKALVPQLLKLFPWRMPADWGMAASVLPLQEYMVSGFRTSLLLLLGAVALVLLIACANLANLLLARAAHRRREMAVRAALGASSGRIVRQLLTESVLLALMGSAAGLLLAPGGALLLRQALPPHLIAQPSASLDVPILEFALLAGLLTGILFGLAPALRARHLDLEHTLRAAAPSAGATRERRRLSSSLVVLETALAVLLTISAGLLTRSLYRLAHEPNGFKTASLVTATLTPSASMCREASRCAAFYDSLRAAVHSLPGVQSAAWSDAVPFGMTLGNTAIAVADNPQYTPNSPYQPFAFSVSPGYFQTMAIPLLKGRDFAEQDDQTMPGVVIVSRAMAERLWPGQDPIGKQVKPSWMAAWRTVVGVVGEVRLYGVAPGAWADAASGALYVPYRQGIVTPPVSLVLTVRTARPAEFAVALPALVSRLNSSVPVSDLRTMDDLIASQIAAPRSTAWLFIAFAALAVLLGAVGIYSLISYSVTAQTREIGIRMALGAGRGAVLRQVLNYGATLASMGVAIGLLAAVGLTRLLRSLLYGVGPMDPATFALVGVILMVVALAASYLPARRAAGIDPMTAIRDE